MTSIYNQESGKLVYTSSMRLVMAVAAILAVGRQTETKAGPVPIAEEQAVLAASETNVGAETSNAVTARLYESFSPTAGTFRSPSDIVNTPGAPRRLLNRTPSGEDGTDGVIDTARSNLVSVPGSLDQTRILIHEAQVSARTDHRSSGQVKTSTVPEPSTLTMSIIATTILAFSHLIRKVRNWRDDRHVRASEWHRREVQQWIVVLSRKQPALLPR